MAETNMGLFVILQVVAWGITMSYVELLDKCGGLNPPDLRRYQVHRLIVPMLLHLDFMHLFWNCLTTFFISPTMEALLSRPSYIILYTSSSVCGFLLSAVCLPYTFTVGASAALMGLFGVCIIDLYLKRHRIDSRSYFIMVGSVAFFVLMSFNPDSGNVWAHLGGLLFGLMYGIFALTPLQEANWYPKAQPYFLVGMIALPVLLIVLFILQPIK